jgi:2-oxoglutarate dehydrogenase E1 component
MNGLRNYGTGGTVHIVVNNQIGFTTAPHDSRSGLYCTDIGKTADAPIFHVNADSIDDVYKVCRLAAQYRQKFKKDVIVDIMGYRRFGHNELDQPLFTQPIMYKKIAKHPYVMEIYRKQLIDEGVITQQFAKETEKQIWDSLEESYKKSKTLKFNMEQWETEAWEEIKKPELYGKFWDTGINEKTLREIGKKIFVLPEDFEFHPQIKKIFEARVKAMDEGQGIDWGTGEALAFASLMTEGYHVRVSGQDAERGTFSHRHAVLHHQTTDDYYMPINQINPNAKIRNFIAANSHLSEYAVLGFEYGYSLGHPNTLTCWEAQFGDFANGAQIMIDTMISSGETKWNTKSGIVMLLPHGYDGQGPEHSSCRVERFLQLSDEDESIIPDENTYQHEIVNWMIVNCTTAANYFHVLRRQLRRLYRKPLICVNPKKMLRLPAAASKLEDFNES